MNQSFGCIHDASPSILPSHLGQDFAGFFELLHQQGDFFAVTAEGRGRQFQFHVVNGLLQHLDVGVFRQGHGSLILGAGCNQVRYGTAIGPKNPQLCVPIRRPWPHHEHAALPGLRLGRYFFIASKRCFMRSGGK